MVVVAVVNVVRVFTFIDRVRFAFKRVIIVVAIVNASVESPFSTKAHVSPTRREFPVFRSSSMQIEEVLQVTNELVEAFEHLVPQLSSSSAPPNREDLEAIVSSPSTVLYVAREGESLLGTLTLALFRIPTGLRAWIEDVVVDGGARARGVGEALNRAALERARALGATSVWRP